MSQLTMILNSSKKKKKNYDIEVENENATGMFHDCVDHVRKY